MKLQKTISRWMIRGLRIVGQIPLVGAAIVKASFDAVRQTWGERSWMFQTLQDSWMEIDSLSRKELQRIHGGLVENSAITQKIRNLFLQFSVGPSGLICTPNASKMAAGGNAEDWNHSRGYSWDRWFRQPELNSTITGGQLTRNWSGLLFDTGEIFINLTQENLTDSKGVTRRRTPKIQTIDSHRCETPAQMREYKGNVLVDGVEMTTDGKVIAYWFKKTNFESLLTAGYQSAEMFDRIEAYDRRNPARGGIIHKFKMRRPGMVRGIPEGFSVYNLVRDNMDLHKLEMQAAKLASDIANVETNTTGELDALSNRRAKMGIGTQSAAGAYQSKNIFADYKVSIGSKNIGLLKGDKLEQFMISRPTVATQDYWDLHYTLICMGYNVPKMLVMPYSLQGTVTRADLDVCGYGFGRENYEIIAELLRDVYEWQTDWAVDYDLSLDGETPLDYYAVFIRPPRAPNVDIGYTAKALEIELKLGVKTVPDVFAEKQQDWRQKIQEICEFQQFVSAQAKKYGTDPTLITELAIKQAADDSGGKSDKPEGDTSPESPEARSQEVVYS